MKILWIACWTVVLTGAGLAASTLPNPSGELNESREELNALSTNYTDQHPLVLMKREQIAKLDQAVALEQLQLQKAREQLKDLLTKYTDQHPLVVAKRGEIAGLEKKAALQGRELASSQPTLQFQQKASELQKAIKGLEDLLTKYPDRHPLILAKRQQIAGLENSLGSH